MRFLLKSAFMIFVLLLIVPFFAPLLLGDKAGRSEAVLPSGRDIGGAVSAARGTIDYMSGMCDERPDVCDDGAGLLGFLGQRARQGAEIVYLYLGEQFAEDEPVPELAPKTTRADQPAAEVTVVERMAEPAATPTDLIRTGAITPEPESAPAPQMPAPANQPVRISGLPENVPLPTRRPR
ncbi:hypothetical protein FF124_15985 [Martelella lutilitoris]|uniref:DUF5330 domain-containing protein n=1 Tax=Martelella lutilitoris TaxID=2583532 RepID=A0A5C4JNM7_9HYPH|nr:DUF5330 domain-containing protein [Martelella lutilitoris]TNB47045.1 hypothetical protein FF124_15985 [Martelella lutilitoris]